MDSPNTPTPPQWDQFTAWCRTLTDLGRVASVLGWDRETRMPASGSDARARQAGLVAAIAHRELVRPDMGDALAAVEAGVPPGSAAMRQVQLMRRRRDRALRLPEDLVRALSEATSRCVTAWIAARPADDYAAFAGPFREVMARTRDAAVLLAGGGDPYDALLDEFEPGTRAADLEPVFAHLRTALAPILAERAARGVHPLPAREWPQGPQLGLARAVATMVGFDAGAGLIEPTAHPFTQTLGAGDVRFSIRHHIRDPLENVMITLHEAGHAMYEQGLPAQYEGTPVGEAPSLGAHESQSRFWENHIGRTTVFWERCLPVVREHMGDAVDGLTVAGFVRAANGVAPTLIRVDADEVTYHLHIALRFVLETQLVRGTLEVDDLPDAWDALMDDMVGVRPERVSAGVMQDIHWPEGLFGYFPTYTLGSLYAAQLAETADEGLGGLDAAVADGRFGDVLAFMRERVHRHGSRYPTPELMRRATGRELSADALLRHLAAPPTA